MGTPLEPDARRINATGALRVRLHMVHILVNLALVAWNVLDTAYRAHGFPQTPLEALALDIPIFPQMTRIRPWPR